ncbi:hypothetical protein [Solicola gregarius]|uniref:Uncharacterized protein n=1 Tax=Solicola gregarius TaxID=2908642 RepID=A0AA46TDT9_9ACTN|nr:hypothetical protein [Solicola gregarius]UYM03451.1 hypothetical protein L0C25_12880 [Solicola gregarius]
MPESESLEEKLARLGREAEVAEFGPRAREIMRESDVEFDTALEQAITERRDNARLADEYNRTRDLSEFDEAASVPVEVRRNITGRDKRG